VNNVRHGNQGRIGNGGVLVEVPYDSFSNDGHLGITGVKGSDRSVRVVGVVEKGGDVDSRDGGDGLQEFRSVSPRRFPGLENQDDFRQDFLGLAQHHKIKNPSQGFGIVRTGPARHHPRHSLPPVLRCRGNARQIQDSQDVGVAELVLETETDEVESLQGHPRFQSAQGFPRFPEFGLEVGPGGIDPVRDDSLQPVQEMVEETESQVAHPDFIHIGKSQREAGRGFLETLPTGVDLAAEVTAGLEHLKQEPFRQGQVFSRGRSHSIPPIMDFRGRPPRLGCTKGTWLAASSRRPPGSPRSCGFLPGCFPLPW